MNPKELPLRLSQDERDELSSLLEGQGWPALLKIIDALVVQLERRVLTSDLTAPNGYQRLVEEKARYEGAVSLQSKIYKIKEQYNRKN